MDILRKILIIILFPVVVHAQDDMFFGLCFNYDRPLLIAAEGGAVPKMYRSYNYFENYTLEQTLYPGGTGRIYGIKIGYDTRNVVFSFNSATSVYGWWQSLNEGDTYASNEELSYAWTSAISFDGTMGLYARYYYPTSVKHKLLSTGQWWQSQGSLPSGTLPRGVALGGDASDVAIVSSNSSTIWYSNSNNYTSYSTRTGPYLGYGDVAISSDMSITYVAPYSSTNAEVSIYTPPFPWNTVIIRSGLSAGEGQVKCSADGQYVLYSHSSGRVWYNNYYGVDGYWVEVLPSVSTKDPYTISISYHGKHMAFTDNTSAGVFYISNNYGATWNSYTIPGCTNPLTAIGIQDIREDIFD